jgi:hypothetical protein
MLHKLTGRGPGTELADRKRHNTRVVCLLAAPLGKAPSKCHGVCSVTASGAVGMRMKPGDGKLYGVVHPVILLLDFGMTRSNNALISKIPVLVLPLHVEARSGPLRSHEENLERSLWFGPYDSNDVGPTMSTCIVQILHFGHLEGKAGLLPGTGEG